MCYYVLERKGLLRQRTKRLILQQQFVSALLSFLVNRGASESGCTGGVCVLHQRRTEQVQSSLPAGRLPAARLHSSPHALSRRRRSRAGAVLPDPRGAAGQPREQQEDCDPVSELMPHTASRRSNKVQTKRTFRSRRAILHFPVYLPRCS